MICYQIALDPELGVATAAFVQWWNAAEQTQALGKSSA